MRNSYQKQLEILHTELIRMGAFCEDAISSAVTGLLDGNAELRDKAVQLEKEIDYKEREIESICMRLLLREQPVAGDLRQITAAQRMITDMERIGDQAADIALLAGVMSKNGGIDKIGGTKKSDIHIGDMAEAIAQMLTASVDSFVESDLGKARDVIRSDDEVDELFRKIKLELIAVIAQDSGSGGACLDLLMIAKYLERIGDHAVNIAEWVVYSITGDRRPLA
jgi:phosphate transport system protein